ncbi:hypothetical protein Gogos_022287, partial [Gossypium gossypioides]|nr:hypothetical protein [Gossypium gossypioides]
RQTPISSPRPVLESCLQLLYIWEVSSRQSLLESCKCANLFEEVDKYNGDECEEEGRCLCFEYIWLSCLPKALGHVDEAVIDLFDQLDKRVTPVPTILAETFRSLSACRKAGEGRFIGCAQLLLVWFYSHF